MPRRTSNRTQRHRKKVSKKYRTKKYRTKKYQRVQKRSKTSRKTRRRRRNTFKKGGFLKKIKRSLGKSAMALRDKLNQKKWGRGIAKSIERNSKLNIWADEANQDDEKRRREKISRPFNVVKHKSNPLTPPLLVDDLVNLPGVERKGGELTKSEEIIQKVTPQPQPEPEPVEEIIQKKVTPQPQPEPEPEPARVKPEFNADQEMFDDVAIEGLYSPKMYEEFKKLEEHPGLVPRTQTDGEYVWDDEKDDWVEVTPTSRLTTTKKKNLTGKETIF